MPTALRPSSLSCEGRNCFGAFSRSFPARCALFRWQKPCIRGQMLSFRAGVRAFPCAGAALLSLGGLLSPPRVGVFGASRCAFASLRPQLGSRPPLRIRSWRAVEKAHRFPLIHNLFSTGLSTLWRNCSPPLAYSSPPFPFPSAGHTDPLPPGSRKCPSRARIYIYRSRERRKGQRAVRRLSLWKREARCAGS